MEKEVLEKLIAKYLSGKSSETEKRELERWYASFETDEGFVSNLNKAEKNELEHKILLKIDQNISTFEGAKANRERTIDYPASFRSTKFYKVAAIFIGLVILSGFAYTLLFNNMVTYSTAYGQTREITLPDNSTVILNGNSTLAYEDNWSNGEPREVHLDGEAFFSVVHKESDQKFIVYTSERFNVEVLGTKFNVSKRESGTRVVLNSGKVRLNFKESEEEKHVVMKPGELVAFKDEPSDYIKKEVNTEVYSSWKDNKLVLDNTSLREILRRIEEDYGLEAKIADKDLLDQKVSGSMPADDIDNLLKNIAVTYEIKIVKNKNSLEIRKALEQ